MLLAEHLLQNSLLIIKYRNEADCEECKVDHEEDLNQEHPLKAQVLLELLIQAVDDSTSMQSFYSFYDGDAGWTLSKKSIRGWKR